MTVVTQSSNRAGSGGGVLTFSDLNDGRADQPFFLGDGWFTCMLNGNPSPGNGITVAGVYNVGSGIASMGVSGSNGQSIIMSIPWKMDLNTLNGLPQYAEYKMLTNNSAPGLLDRRGPIVFARPNAGRCYYLSIQIDTLIAHLRRVDNANVTIADLGPNWTIALGDVHRIEVDNSDPANIKVTGFRNGVAQVIFIDSSASRLASGVPGIFDEFCSTGIVQTFSNFNCGAL